MKTEFDAGEMNRLIQAVARGLDLDPAEITPESRFAEDLLADSFDMAMILAEGDEAFGTAIPSEEAEVIRTVGDLAAEVRAYPASRRKARPVRWSSGSTH